MNTARSRHLLLALVALLSPGWLSAQKSIDDARRQPTAEDIARVNALMSKQKEHEILGHFAGTWEGTLQTKVRGNPPSEVPSPATLEMRWMLDGYFLESDETLRPGAKDVTIRSRAIYGYNSFEKYYYRTVFQAGDPREYVSTGTWDAATRTLTFTGPEHNKVTGDDFQRRDTFRILGEDRIGYELAFIFKDGSELTAVQGTYQKKKG
jgi:hypothetical protein